MWSDRYVLYYKLQHKITILNIRSQKRPYQISYHISCKQSVFIPWKDVIKTACKECHAMLHLP